MSVRAGRHLGKALTQLNKDVSVANTCLPPQLQVPVLPPLPGAAREQLPPQQSQQQYGSGDASVHGRGGGMHMMGLRRPLSPARSDAAWSEISAATSTM
jgi:hypothetical protein